MSKRWDDWPRGLRWLIGVATVALVLAIVWTLFVPVADWLAHQDVGSAKGPLLETARDAARGRLLTLGAGLFAVGALVYTARNYGLSREGQVTDRYTKAIEQLGSDRLDVRIGGIYALERIARDSSRDHPTVIEVLSAFVREHSREQWLPLPADDPSDDRPPERITPPDVQAAVTVIGRRNPRHDHQAVDLAAANLTGADLADADLSGARLPGADLTGARLSRARLSEAYLTGAQLTGARLADADFTGAHLRGANFTDAYLTGANFTGAVLTAAHWPRDAEVPEGWHRDTRRGSGRLRPADADSGDSATT